MSQLVKGMPGIHMAFGPILSSLHKVNTVVHGCNPSAG